MALSDAAKTRSMRLGGGGRFKRLEGQLDRKGVQDPAALAAWIGRRKYGSARFNKLAAKGRK
jgi:hypothetical protein